MLAHLIAVIAPQHDDGVVESAALLERRQHQTDLGVDIADGGEIAVHQLAFGRLGQGVAGRNAVVLLDLLDADHGAFRRADRRQLIRRQGQLRRVVEIPVLLRADVGDVRILKADGEEERLRAEALDGGGRGGGVGTIQQVGITAGGRFPRRAARLLLPGRHIAAGGAGLFDQGVLALGAFDAVARPQFVDVRHRPAHRIIESVVIDLAERAREPAAVLEVLRQRHHRRHHAAEIAADVFDAGGRRPAAGHQADPRRTAQGLLAIRAFKERAARGDTIDVGRLHRAAVAPQLGPQVIDGDEQHVGPLSSGEGGDGTEGGGEAHGGSRFSRGGRARRRRRRRAGCWRDRASG